MNIKKQGKWFLLFSLLVMLPGLISLGINGLKLAIDFTGGSVFVYSADNVEQHVSTIKSKFELEDIEIEKLVLDGEDTLTIRSKPVSVEKGQIIDSYLKENIEGIEQGSFETIGPAIGSETTKNSFTALGVASIGIVLYIAYSFRNIRKPYSSWKFGLSAVIAMLHDALMVLGVFSILGYIYGVEIDALFITAMLTVIGFSVHDSIVVFDRVRENLAKLPKSKTFAEVVDYSIVETLNRSFATSLTVVLTLLSLFVLGGESIKYFVLALLIGVISGTYSSIFTASPILVMWESKDNK